MANFFDHYATDADTQISVTDEDFSSARKELVPSVSVEELRHYERVRSAFEGTTKKPTDVQSGQGDASLQQARRMLERANGDGVRLPLANGGVRARPGQQQDGGASDDENDEDEYVIRTQHLSVDDGSTRPPSNKGKGKARSHGFPAQPQNTEANGEDLYD